MKNKYYTRAIITHSCTIVFGGSDIWLENIEFFVQKTSDLQGETMAKMVLS